MGLYISNTAFSLRCFIDKSENQWYNIFKIKDKEPAYLSKTGVACSAGEKYPVYIPHLMPKINFGIPTTSIIQSKGTLCFKNSPECRVLTASVIKTQNYLDIPFERNKSWKGQSSVLKDGTEIISKNTKVICNCPSNSISDMTFSND